MQPKTQSEGFGCDGGNRGVWGEIPAVGYKKNPRGEKMQGKFPAVVKVRSEHLKEKEKEKIHPLSQK